MAMLDGAVGASVVGPVYPPARHCASVRTSTHRPPSGSRTTAHADRVRVQEGCVELLAPLKRPMAEEVGSSADGAASSEPGEWMLAKWCRPRLLPLCRRRVDRVASLLRRWCAGH